MGRYLVIANQTLGGPELDEKIQLRIEHGEGRFHVVVPMVAPEHEVSTRVPVDPIFAMPPPTEPTADSLEQARKRSEHRLKAMVERITKLGGEADGELGDTDPYRATKAAVEREHFDEVIISTLPIGISRWIKMDLPSRVERLVEIPVTTVEAESG